MNETIILALVGGGFAIAGSLTTGWFTYASAARQKQIEQYKQRLSRAYRDIAALHRLEERYIIALANDQVTAEAWKRRIRKQLREDGFDSPSESATWRQAEQNLQDL